LSELKPIILNIYRKFTDKMAYKAFKKKTNPTSPTEKPKVANAQQSKEEEPEDNSIGFSTPDDNTVDAYGKKWFHNKDKWYKEAKEIYEKIYGTSKFKVLFGATAREKDGFIPLKPDEERSRTNPPIAAWYKPNGVYDGFNASHLQNSGWILLPVKPVSESTDATTKKKVNEYDVYNYDTLVYMVKNAKPLKTLNLHDYGGMSNPKVKQLIDKHFSSYRDIKSDGNLIQVLKKRNSM